MKLLNKEILREENKDNMKKIFYLIIGIIIGLLLANILIACKGEKNSVLSNTLNKEYSTKEYSEENNGNVENIENTEKNEIIEENKNNLFSQIDIENYGDYIDLETDFSLTETKLEDGTTAVTNWRIFYKDTENKEVYAILADYLPYKYNDEFKINLGQYFTDGSHPYNWSTSNIYDKKGLSEDDYLIETLNDENAWKVLLANTRFADNDNVKVIGAVDLDTWEKSWNQGKDEETLYFPHKQVISECFGYWLASKNTSGNVAYAVENVTFRGKVEANCAYDGSISVRPVVILNQDLEAECEELSGNKIWKIK